MGDPYHHTDRKNIFVFSASLSLLQPRHVPPFCAVMTHVRSPAYCGDTPSI